MKRIRSKKEHCYLVFLLYIVMSYTIYIVKYIGVHAVAPTKGTRWGHGPPIQFITPLGEDNCRLTLLYLRGFRVPIFKLDCGIF